MLVLALTTMAAEKQKKPDLAFLEYLASLEKVDGKLVGPIDMLENEESVEQAPPLTGVDPSKSRKDVSNSKEEGEEKERKKEKGND